MQRRGGITNHVIMNQRNGCADILIERSSRSDIRRAAAAAILRSPARLPGQLGCSRRCRARRGSGRAEEARKGGAGNGIGWNKARLGRETGGWNWNWIPLAAARARLFRWPLAIPASFSTARLPGCLRAVAVALPCSRLCSSVISRHKSLPSRDFEINLFFFSREIL